MYNNANILLKGKASLISVKIKLLYASLFSFPRKHSFVTTTFKTSEPFLQDESSDNELSTSNENLSENKQVSELKSKMINDFSTKRFDL